MVAAVPLDDSLPNPPRSGTQRARSKSEKEDAVPETLIVETADHITTITLSYKFYNMNKP